jgi:hypothetical protein
MKTPGRELIDALEKVAFLEWYRHPMGGQNADNFKSITVVWRFDKNRTSEEQAALIAEKIQSAIDTVARFDWVLRYSGRNWVLSPAKVVSLEKSGRFRMDVEIYIYINQEEPDFFNRMYPDLVKISDAILDEQTEAARTSGAPPGGRNDGE